MNFSEIFKAFIPINASGGSRKSEFSLEDVLARTPTVSWGSKGIESANADPNAGKEISQEPWLDKKYGYDPSGKDTVQQNIASNFARVAYDKEQARLASEAEKSQAAAAAKKKADEDAAAKAAAATAVKKPDTISQAKEQPVKQTSSTDSSVKVYSQDELSRTTPRERSAAEAASAQGIDYWKTTTPESRASQFAKEDAAKTYSYKGHEWDDPIAKQVYQQFNPQDFEKRTAYGGGTFYDTALKSAQFYGPTGEGYGKASYNTFISPKSWNTVYQGDVYKQMREEYIKRGGLGA